MYGIPNAILKPLVTLAGLLVAVLITALALANRNVVRLSLDPFRPDDPAISLELPFFVFLLGSLIAGVVLGGLANWLSHGRVRRIARQSSSEASRWRREAERLTRERDLSVTAGGRGTGPGARSGEGRSLTTAG